MKLSQAVLEVEEWLENGTYGFEITEVQMGGNGEYRFYITEYYPVQSADEDDSTTYFMTVEPDGKLINDNGEDCVATLRSAADKLPDLIQFCDDFEQKWYRKEVA